MRLLWLSNCICIQNHETYTSGAKTCTFASKNAGKSSKCAHWKYKISGCRNLKNWLHWQIGQETKGWNARYRDNEYFIVENWNQILRVSSLNSNSYFCVWRFFGRFSRGGGRCCRGRAAFVGPILFENDNAHDVADIYIFIYVYILWERGCTCACVSRLLVFIYAKCF